MSRWSGLDVVAEDASDNPCIVGSESRVWDVVNAYDDGNPSQQIAHRYSVPLRTVQAILAFAHRYLPEKDPINWSACDAVECVRRRCGGVPVLKGTRMPVAGILGNLADGMTAEEVAEDFEVDVVAVRVVAHFFDDLRRLPLAS